LSLITLTQFKTFPLGLKDAILDKITDPVIQEFLDTASTQVENHCSRQLASAEVVQDIPGNGENMLLLREYPVTAIASIAWEDDLGITGTDDVTDLRVSERSGILQWRNKRSGPFLRGRLYTITYTAGYDPIPGPIRQATALWATELLQPIYNQFSTGKATTLVELSSEQIVELLEDYRRKGVRG
jgi:hypothetical protein